MGNYVTTATRPHPTIGYDPCPGSPEGTRALAGQIREFAWKIEDLSAFLQGARSDMDYGGWVGDSRRAFQESMVEFPPKLEEFRGALESVHGALDGWADDLESFQSRSLELDTQLSEAQQAVSTAAGALEGWEDTGDNRHELLGLQGDQLAASNLLRDAQAAVKNLEDEYRERAEHYGDIINGAGDRSWDRSFWDRLGDVADWIEDSWIGDVARAIAPVADWVSTWGGIASGVLTVAGVICLAIPPAWPAVPFLFGGAAITGTAATAGDVVLASAGYGDWGTAGLGLLTIGIGKGVTAAGARIMKIYRDSGRAEQLVRVRTSTGSYEYVPSMFTAREMHDSELVWQAIRLKGTQAQWGITGYLIYQGNRPDGAAGPVSVGYEGYESANPWDLPPNAAYLEDRDGALVK